MAGCRVNDPRHPAPEIPGSLAPERGVAHRRGASGGNAGQAFQRPCAVQPCDGQRSAGAGGDGVFLDHTERYEASAEFTRVWRRLLEGETVTFEGKHIHVRDAQLYFPPVQQPRLPLFWRIVGRGAGAGGRAGRSLSDWANHRSW